MRYKRTLIFFIMMLSFLLYACGTKEKEDRTGEVGDSKDQQKNQGQDADQASGTDTTEVTISEQVLYDEGGLKITATSLEMEEFLGPEIKVLIENNTDQDITVQTREVSINDLMMEPTFSSDVAAGKKANDSISFFKNELERNAIDKIAKIELRLNIFAEDFDTIAETDPILIYTTAKDNYVQTYDDSGKVLYEKNGIRIIDKGLANDEFFGPEIRVYIENNTTKAITVQVENVSVNGFMADPIFSSDISPGKKINDGISFLDLDENGIERIEEAELSFNIFDMNSLDDIDISDPIRLTYE